MCAFVKGFFLAVTRLAVETGRDRREMRELGKGKKEREDSVTGPAVER